MVETTECNRTDFEIFFENLSVGFGCNCLDYNRMQPKSKIHNRRVKFGAFLGCWTPLISFWLWNLYGLGTETREECPFKIVLIYVFKSYSILCYIKYT